MEARRVYLRELALVFLEAERVARAGVDDLAQLVALRFVEPTFVEDADGEIIELKEVGTGTRAGAEAFAEIGIDSDTHGKIVAESR
jgi:hypothetical protein